MNVAMTDPLLVKFEPLSSIKLPLETCKAIEAFIQRQRSGQAVR